MIWRSRAPGQSKVVSEASEGLLSSLYRRVFKLRLPPAQASLPFPSVLLMRIDLGILDNCEVSDCCVVSLEHSADTRAMCEETSA